MKTKSPKLTKKQKNELQSHINEIVQEVYNSASNSLNCETELMDIDSADLMHEAFQYIINEVKSQLK